MKIKRKLGMLVIAVMPVLVPAAALAQAQWKWRDAQGHTQYSDLPPPRSVPDNNILQRPANKTAGTSPLSVPASAAVPAPAAASASDPALEAKRRQTEQAEVNKRKLDEARQARQKAENCDRARAALRTLDSGQRMFRTNTQGEREFLDDAARAAETQRARQAIATECN